VSDILPPVQPPMQPTAELPTAELEPEERQPSWLLTDVLQAWPSPPHISGPLWGRSDEQAGGETGRSVLLSVPPRAARRSPPSGLSWPTLPPFGPEPQEPQPDPSSQADARGPWALWALWLRLTSPHVSSTSGLLNASARERLRRARLLSIFLLSALGVDLALAPEAARVPTLAYGVIGSAPIILVCCLLNRLGRVITASALFAAGVAASVAATQLLTPDGLTMRSRTAFDFFVVPIVIAGVLLPRRMSALLWLGCAAFTGLDITFAPRQADLNAFIAQVGLYSAITAPILIMSVVALVSWIAAGSVERAIQEADRTYELERAYLYIASQKRRLEEAIVVLQEIHARAANGDLSARATITSGELAPLAHSLNLMLERLARSRGAELTLEGIEQTIQRLERATGELAQGHLEQSVPQQEMGRLTLVALHLEQLRSGILKVLRSSAGLAERIAATSRGLAEARRAESALLRSRFPGGRLSSPPVAKQREQMAQAEQELLRLTEQLHAYLRHFAE